MTSAVGSSMQRRAFTVRRSGSPGPAPTRSTLPLLDFEGSKGTVLAELLLTSRGGACARHNVASPRTAASALGGTKAALGCDRRASRRPKDDAIDVIAAIVDRRTMMSGHAEKVGALPSFGTVVWRRRRKVGRGNGRGWEKEGGRLPGSRKPLWPRRRDVPSCLILHCLACSTYSLCSQGSAILPVRPLPCLHSRDGRPGIGRCGRQP